MAGFSVDAPGFAKLSRDLVAAANRMPDKVQPVVAKGAVQIKGTMRDDMQASIHFGQVAPSISYDISADAGGVEAEIGPVTEGRTVGDLAHFAYFGAPNGGGGTVRDPQENLDDEAPQFLKALSDVLGDLL